MRKLKLWLFHSGFVTLAQKPLLVTFMSLLAVWPVSGQTVVVNLPAQSGVAEIQKALDQLPADGEVVLAPGTYLITEPILLRHDRQTLRGSGATTILYLAEQANCPVVILGAPLNPSHHMTGQLRLADLTIDGNRAHQRSEFWRCAVDNSQLNNNGVDIWNTIDATVEKVVCGHCRSGGLVVSAGTRRLTIRDFTAFDNQFDGLACYLTEDSHFSDLNLHDNLAAGISLDLDFNHNFIDNAVLTGNDLGVFMRQSRNNEFAGVTIARSRKDGVFMAQTAGMGTSGWELRPGTECVGNTFSKLSINDCGGNAFRVNDLSCTNNVITNSTFHANTKGGLIAVQPNLVTVSELVER
jgi:hypothetical protein